MSDERTTESLASRVPAALRMRAKFIVLGLPPFIVAQRSNVTPATARRVAAGEGRADDPRRAVTVSLLDSGGDKEILSRCVSAAALLRRAGHQTPEIQAVLLSVARPILEAARDLKAASEPRESSGLDFEAEDALGEPGRFGGYLAAVDGGGSKINPD